jgi:uncharacterized protein (DUF58 family)
LNALSLTERFRLSRFFLGEKPSDETIRLTHRRIFILPTRQGLGFGLLLIVLLLIAFVYNNNLAYLLTFLLASVFFITILHTFKALSGLIVYKGRTTPVFLGEPAYFEIHIENPSLTLRHQLRVSLEKTEILAIQAQAKINLALLSTPKRRGWHNAGTITLATTFPLGLFRAWSPIRFHFKTLVYPKPATTRLPLPECVSGTSQYEGKGQGADDFYGLQNYQFGDSIKHIHWKAYAKGLGVYSKQYSGGQERKIWLDYQQTPGRNTEERLSQLCRWLGEAEAQGLCYGFKLADLTLPPDCGAAHYQRCLEALALF